MGYLQQHYIMGQGLTEDDSVDQLEALEFGNIRSFGAIHYLEILSELPSLAGSQVVELLAQLHSEEKK